MRKSIIIAFFCVALVPFQAGAQVSKSTIESEVNASTAAGLPGANILNNIVKSYVDWLTCTGSGGTIYWSAGTPTCLAIGTQGQYLNVNAGLPQWASFGTGVGAALGNPLNSSGGVAGFPFPNNSLTLEEFPIIGANTVLCSIAGGTPIACPSVVRAPNPGNLFVTSTGNDSNTCLSGSPCLTLQHAINVALQDYDFQGSNIIINVGTGTFAGATVGGPNPGGGGTAALVIVGNGASNTTIDGITANDYANIAIGSMNLSGTGSGGFDILGENSSTVTLFDSGVNFGAATTALVELVSNSRFNGSNALGFTISGAAGAAFLISINSNVLLSANATFTITGTPAFVNGFVNAIDGSGYDNGINSVWSGSATGPTYNLSINSWVDMEQNANPLPGSTGGVLQYGSSYYGSPVANAIGIGSNSFIYNFGTWTPTVSTTATQGTPAYAIQVGSFEQIGRQITARFTLELSGWTGSPTGSVLINGLPVASANVTNDDGVCYISNYNVTGLASSNFGISGQISPNSSSFALAQAGTTVTSAITVAQFGTTATIIGMCHYHV